jgi:Peptidase family M28
MRKLLLLPLVLAMVLVLGWLGGQPPQVRASEVAGQFSPARASALVADIARAPHLAGSAEHVRVRKAIIARLRTLGLSVEVQTTTAVRQNARFGNAIAVSPVANIIAVLPGRDRSRPAVAVMAHYDSVAFAPGAGDDAAGTAAVLETARILSAGPQPARDVAFVVTDSEELGLLGAQAFFDDHPLAKRIGAVVNVEARGSRGLATMFQTSAGNAALVDLWARNATAPSGNSLTSAVYRLLPNDTDLTVVLGAGKIGINAAFIDGQFDYHSPTDSAANLDRRTLQQLGDFAVTTTRALAFADTLPARDGDSAYFDVFGLGVVRYPVWLGWGLLAVAVFGLATLPVRKFETSWRDITGGAVRVLLVTLLAGGACHLLAALIHGGGTIAMRERLAEAPAALWMYLALCLGVVLVARTRSGLWLGSIALLVLVAAVAQALFAGASWLFIWPALAALAVAHVAGRTPKESAAPLLVAAIGGGFVLAAVAQVVIAAYVGLGSMTPLVVALIVPFVVALAGLLLMTWTQARWAGRGAAAMLAASGAGAVLFAATDGFSPRHPRPGDLFHLTDADSGKSWWATSSSPAELPAQNAVRVEVPASKRFELWGVSAPSAPMQRPAFALAQDGRALRLTVSTPDTRRLLLLSLRSSVPLDNVRLNGRPVKVEAGNWTSIGWRAAVPASLVLEAQSAKPGKVEVRYLTAIDGLPPGAPPPGGPPTNWTLLSGSRAVMGTMRADIR